MSNNTFWKLVVVGAILLILLIPVSLSLLDRYAPAGEIRVEREREKKIKSRIVVYPKLTVATMSKMTPDSLKKLVTIKGVVGELTLTVTPDAEILDETSNPNAKGIVRTYDPWSDPGEPATLSIGKAGIKWHSMRIPLKIWGEYVKGKSVLLTAVFQWTGSFVNRQKVQSRHVDLVLNGIKEADLDIYVVPYPIEGYSPVYIVREGEDLPEPIAMLRHKLGKK